jgi:dipeptidyl aminopeptidase/acylaminoacyl peptidase
VTVTSLRFACTFCVTAFVALAPQFAAPQAEPRAKPAIEALRTPARVASGQVTENGGGWNRAVQRITYRSAADGSDQPMMFYRPQTSAPRPLLVALHSWSATYRQSASAIYAEWAIANDWVFIHPQFRGPNVRPQATGSDLVIADVLSAIDYAKANAQVDDKRIYSVGWSGGGYLALLLAGREPQLWAGVSAWVPISDLNAWYRESARLKTKYARQIEASCGGNPTTNEAAAEECRRRSALTYLDRARGIAIDLNHGIRDGHGSAPVPVSQSLHAFNALVPSDARFSDEEIAAITRNAKIPPELRQPAQRDAGGLRVLLRRESGAARVPIFDGAHDKNTEAAVRWLNEQRKP